MSEIVEWSQAKKSKNWEKRKATNLKEYKNKKQTKTV